MALPEIFKLTITTLGTGGGHDGLSALSLQLEINMITVSQAEGEGAAFSLMPHPQLCCGAILTYYSSVITKEPGFMKP